MKSLVEEGRERSTQSARQGATALGIDFDGMCEILRSLRATDFHKSMTTHENHTAWQDVYRPTTQAGDIYLKITVIDDLLFVSFKEL